VILPGRDGFDGPSSLVRAGCRLGGVPKPWYPIENLLFSFEVIFILKLHRGSEVHNGMYPGKALGLCMFYGAMVFRARYTGRKGGFLDLLVFDLFLKLLSEELAVLKVLLQL
jgi:hypothetical protein